MALNGTISSKWKGYEYVVEWRGTQDVSNNKTTITCTHKLKCDASWSLRISSRTITCTIGSSTQSFNCSDINASGGTTINLGTTTHTVAHNNDGTMSVGISSSFPIQATISGTYKDSIVATGTLTLDTIPRASTITSFPEFTMGSAGTITISRPVSSYTHTLKYVFGNKSENIKEKTSDTSISWTPEINKLAPCLPNDTRGWGTFILITYSGNNEVGRQEKRFYCNVPDSVKPTINSVKLTPDPINGNYELIKNMNQLTITAIGANAGIGASIKSYKFTGTGANNVIQNDSSLKIGPINTVGDLTYTVTVTDTRNRTALQTGTISCREYITPYFSAFTPFLQKNEESNKNQIRCKYSIKRDVNSPDDPITLTIYYKKSSDQSYSVGYSGSITSDAMVGSVCVLDNVEDFTYNIYAELIDSYGFKSTTGTKTVLSSQRVMDITPSGTGIGIGKRAESDNLVDIQQKVISRSGFSLSKIDKECVIFGAYNLMTHDQGQNTTFNIGKDVSNFGYIEIFYSDSTNQTNYSTKIHNPNGKYVMLMSCGDDGVLKCSKWLINGTNIEADSNVRNANIKIHKILGYLS